VTGDPISFSLRFEFQAARNAPVVFMWCVANRLILQRRHSGIGFQHEDGRFSFLLSGGSQQGTEFHAACGEPPLLLTSAVEHWFPPEAWPKS
jgi:hypothetical protein